MVGAGLGTKDTEQVLPTQRDDFDPYNMIGNVEIGLSEGFPAPSEHHPENPGILVSVDQLFV